MHPLIIGIAGGSGSGKSTLAQRIAESLPGSRVAFLDMDGYYHDQGHLSLEERRRVNWDHPDAIDIPLFATHLAALARGEAISKPTYDFVAHRRRLETVSVEPAEVVVVDGILLLVDEQVRRSCHMKVYMDADADVRLIRRIRRDMATRGRPLDEILDQYLSTVQPMHERFVEPSKRHADIVIPRGGENLVALDLLVASISRRLEEVSL